MFVILAGQLELRGEVGGEIITFPVNGGEVTGVLPFSRMKEFTVSGRALTESRLLRFPRAKFPELVQKMPELTQRLVGLMSDRIRETTRIEQQRDRLVSLGKLSAGLAHELNNPASAAQRAASQLRGTLKRIKDASHELGRRELTAAQKSEIERLETSLIQCDDPPPDALTMSDLEERIDSLLRSHGQSDLVATGGRSGAEERQTRGLGIAVRGARCGHRSSRPGTDRRLARDREHVERNREQHLKNIRPGPRD